MGQKTVFHIDVNSAFLSWSAAYRVYVLGEDLDLRNVPSIVGGDQESRHGIVLAKSVPAKQYGIHTGEPVLTAKKKCSGLKVIPPDYQLYVQASRALIHLLKQYSDRVVQYSIDEAWVEFDGFEGLYGPMTAFAYDLKQEIWQKLGFTVNIGISNNYLLAKTAGGFRKPNRVHTLFPEEIPEKLWRLPVKELFFVGSAAEKKLKNLGISTIGDLANTDVELLKSHMKTHGEIIWNYANGRELEPYIFQQKTQKGYGNSMTAPVDVADVAGVRQILRSLCETIGMRLRMDNVTAGRILVSMTTCQFQRYSRQSRLLAATNVTEELYRESERLFTELWDQKTPLRQIGVHTGRMEAEEGRQYQLFQSEDYGKYEKWNRTIDRIREVYGEDTVMRSSFLISQDIPHMGGGLSRVRRTGVTLGISLDKEGAGG